MLFAICMHAYPAGASTRDELLKHSFKLRTVKAGEQTVNLETSITQEAVQNINAFALAKNIQIVALYRAPGKSGLYFAIGSGGRKSTGTDFGLRLYLLKYSGGKTSLLTVTR